MDLGFRPLGFRVQRLGFTIGLLGFGCSGCKASDILELHELDIIQAKT